MGFRNGAYATVWETKPGNGNWTDARISISKKNKNGEYETDFSGFVRFIGQAHSDAAYLKERARIKIGECDVTSRYDKEKKVTYTNFAIFSFNDADSHNEAQKPSGGNEYMQVPDDDELPFR